MSLVSARNKVSVDLVRGHAGRFCIVIMSNLQQFQVIADDHGELYPLSTLTRFVLQIHHSLHRRRGRLHQVQRRPRQPIFFSHLNYLSVAFARSSFAKPNLQPSVAPLATLTRGDALERATRGLHFRCKLQFLQGPAYSLLGPPAATDGSLSFCKTQSSDLCGQCRYGGSGASIHWLAQRHYNAKVQPRYITKAHCADGYS